MKLRVWRIRERHYGSVIFLVVGPWEEMAGWLLRRYKWQAEQSSLLGTTFFPYLGLRREYVVWLPRWEGRCVDHSVLAHECQHVVCRRLDDCGLKLNEGSSEAWAYFMGWLYGEMVWCLDRPRKAVA